MSVQLIQQLVKAAGASAEVCGGRVSYLDDAGKKTVLGGPSGETNTFGLTPEGQALLEAKARKAVKARKAEAEPEAAPMSDELPDL